jgi:hypothetical protein
MQIANRAYADSFSIGPCSIVNHLVSGSQLVKGVRNKGLKLPKTDWDNLSAKAKMQPPSWKSAVFFYGIKPLF